MEAGASMGGCSNGLLIERKGLGGGVSVALSWGGRGLWLGAEPESGDGGGSVSAKSAGMVFAGTRAGL